MGVILGTIDVTKRFKIPGQKPIEVLKGVNFSVKPGEKVAIVGRSGAGKSTLLNILGGLARQTSGTVTRPRNIGFVFQQYHLMGELTVLENVLLPTMGSRFADAAAGEGTLFSPRRRATELLEKVGLGGRLDHLPSELSGGEQQRVAIARAIAKNPKLLLCDEPTGALDYQTGKAILKLLQSLSTEKGMTVVIITHNSALTAMADRVIKVKNGKITSNIINKDPVNVEKIEW